MAPRDDLGRSLHVSFDAHALIALIATLSWQAALGDFKGSEALTPKP